MTRNAGRWTSFRSNAPNGRTPWHLDVAPWEAVIETVERFLQRVKWVSDEALLTTASILLRSHEHLIAE